MADAKAKAEHLAELADAQLGKATYISENNQVPPTIYWPDRCYEEALSAVETPISPGEMEISLTVQVVYTLLY